MASASSSCSAHLLAFVSTPEPLAVAGTMVNVISTYKYMYNNQKTFSFSNHAAFRSNSIAKIHPLKPKAVPSQRNTKPNSVICADCDGNGAIPCSQCKGTGVNSVDFFNGEFKAGDSCWLCGGRKQILCGNCNGAGFIGGFMSTDDE